MSSRLAAWACALSLTLVELAGAGAPAAAQAGAPAIAPGPLPAGVVRASQVEGIAEFRLANGLQVLLVPDAAKPTTTVNLTLRVGSRHENYGETGMAHLLEHMIFKGTPTTPNVWAEFARRGMRPNGSTWVDRTNYFASFAVNPDTQQWYLGWLADALVNSKVARSDLDTEMTVVRNEMEMGENDPGQVLFQSTLAAMYRWHNYGKSTIGARSDVENVDIARLQAFYRTYYQPDNATLVVAGSFDAAQTLGWIAQGFGAIAKPTRVIEPTYTLDAAQDGERSVDIHRVGGAPQLLMGYHVPAAAHPDFAAVELLTSVLGSTPGGRLHRRLVEGKLAAATYGFTLDLAEPGAAMFGAQLAPGQDVAAARTAMAATLDGVASSPVTAEELERARTQWLKAWELGFTDPERIGIALSESVAQGDWRLYFLARDRVRKVTLADVQRVARERLLPSNRSVGIYRPTAEPRRAPVPAKVDVAKLVEGYQGDPAAAQAEAFDATPANLDARTQRLQVGGLQVGLLPKGTRGRAVQALLRLRFGDAQSLQGTEVAGNLLGALFDKGGAGMSRQQVADAFDRLRANVDFSLDGQVLAVRISTTRDHLPEVIALVGKLLREPALDAAALAEVRSQWLAQLEEQRKEPGALVANALRRHGNPYPRADLRYVPTFDEQEADVKAVTLAQVRALHRRVVSAAQGEFAAVGDMDAPAVRQALDRAFGGWRQPAGGALAYTRVPEPLVKVAPERIVIRTPDKANANMAARLALPVRDSDPDYPALLVANHMLGYLGTGRLWNRIREQEGLSYDVRSGAGWNPDEPNSIWSASAIFAPQNQPKVEAAFTQELQRSVREGFSQRELDEARRSLLNARKLSRAQDAATTAQLAEQLRLGRRFALSQQVDDAIAALTLAQVNAAWQRHIDPARLVIGWAGDFKPPQ